MSSPLHSKQTTADGIHTALSYIFDTAVDRLAADGYMASDIGKLAIQLDDNSVWMLISISPITWNAAIVDTTGLLTESVLGVYLDGYALKNEEDQRWIDTSEQLQEIRDSLDGYNGLSSNGVSETTFQENKNTQEQVNQSILQSLDGYALLAIEDQRWIDTSQQLQDLRNASDGYDNLIYSLSQTELEHTQYQDQFNQSIVQSLDGYAITIVENQRWLDTSQQLQDLRDAADGYQIEINALVSETTFQENKTDQQQINQTILQSLDGYQSEINTINTTLGDFVSEQTFQENKTNQQQFNQSVRQSLDGYALLTIEDQRWIDSSQQLQDLRNASDGYSELINELAQTELEHTQQQDQINQSVIQSLDGYSTKIIEDQRWINSSQQLQDLRNAADGYQVEINLLTSEQTFQENKTAQSQINQTILQSLDGYALLAIEDQRWIDSSQQLQDIRDSLDGYSNSTSAGVDEQTFQENKTAQQQINQSILQSLDGYALLITEDQRWVNSSQQLQDLRNAADGYQAEINNLTPNQTFQENKTAQSQIDQSILQSLDGYALAIIEDQRWIDSSQQLQNIRDSLDGYSTSNSSGVSDQTFQENKSAQQQFNQSIQQSLDGYALLTIENQRWVDASQQLQDLRNAADGYAGENGVSETTFQENKNTQEQINQSVLQSLDGYALLNIENQRWVDSSQQIQDLRDASDGYQSQINSLVSENTFQENKTDQQQINQTILQSLDGYALSTIEDQRWVDSSQQLQDLRDASDGYQSQINNSVNEQTFQENKTAQQQINQTILQSLDGYALLAIEDQRWIDSSQQIQDIRDSLDGYAEEIIANIANLNVSEATQFSSELTPSSIIDDVDDYNPPGLDTATTLRINQTGVGHVIYGLAGGTAGRILIIENISMIDFTFWPEAVSSTDINRFDISDSIILPAKRALIAIYDATSARWRLIAEPITGALISLPWNIKTVDNNTGESDYIDVQTAVDSVASGTVILVGPGTYSVVSLPTSKNLIIIGVGSAILPEGSSGTVNNTLISTTLVAVGDATAFATASSGTGRIVLNNLRLQIGYAASGSGDHAIKGIYFQAGNMYVDNCYIRLVTVSDGGGTTRSFYGVYVSTAGTFEARNTTIEIDDSANTDPDTTTAGIYIDAAATVILENVRFKNGTPANARKNIIVNHSSATVQCIGVYGDDEIEVDAASSVILEKGSVFAQITGSVTYGVVDAYALGLQETNGPTNLLVGSISDGLFLQRSGSNIIGAGVIQQISAGTESVTNGSILFSNLNGVSFGLNAGTLTASISPSANINFSAGTTSSGLNSVVFSDLNGVSFGLNGSTITASISPSGGDAIRGIAAGGSTASTNTVNFSNSNGISFGFGAAGNSTVITASHNGLTSQSNQAASASNGSFAFQTIAFSNANNVTFGTSAGSIISASVSPETPFGISAGTQSVSTGTLIFSNSNNITFGMSGSSQITASFSTNPETPFGISAGTQSVSTGTLVFSNSNGITFGMSGSSQITASHNGLTSQSNQALSGSNGSFTFQTATFGNLNGMSFYTSNGSMVGSYTVPTVTNSSMTVSDAATSGTLARLAFTNLNGVTLSLSTGAGGSHTIVGSHNALTSQSNQAASAANGSFAFQTLSFSNLNGISFGTSAGLALTASHNALTSQSNQAASASNGSFAFQTIAFSNANNVTFGTSAGSIITASVAAPGAAAESNWFTLAGNVAGNSSASGSTIQFSAGNNITLSGTNGSIIRIDAAGGGGANYTALTFQNRQLGASSTTTGQNSLWLAPMRIVAPVSASTLLQLVSITGSSSSNTGSVGITYRLGLWQQTNTTNLSVLDTLLWSAGVSITGFMSSSNSCAFTMNGGGIGQNYTSASANSNLGTQVWGIRNMTFNIGSTLDAGLYVFGWLISTSNAGNSAAIRSFGPVIDNPMPSAQGLGFGAATNASIGYADAGTYLTTTNALPATLNLTQIGQVSNRAPFVKIGAL